MSKSKLPTAALGRSLARDLLGCGLASRGLLDCLLDGGLLDCRLDGGPLDCLLDGGLLDCLLDGGPLDCLLDGGPLHDLLSGSPLHDLLSRRLPDCLLDDPFPHRLARAARRNATFHCWSFRREALCPRDNRFELSAGPKRRHGGGLNFHRLAGARIPRDTRSATALLA